MKTTCKQIGIILLVSGFFAFIAHVVHPRKIPWVQDWSNQVEAKARQQQLNVIPLSAALKKVHQPNVIFIDARPTAEFMKAHIPGARSIPVESMEEQFLRMGTLIDSGKELVVYCRNRECDDSLVLATELQSMGASNVVLFIDGFDVWRSYGGAVEGRESYRPDDGRGAE